MSKLEFLEILSAISEQLARQTALLEAMPDQLAKMVAQQLFKTKAKKTIGEVLEEIKATGTVLPDFKLKIIGGGNDSEGN
jgi:Mg/Co/Ni transporter MgtE